jgi:23S rRNA (uracil1939-C5)-methyltransferase
MPDESGNYAFPGTMPDESGNYIIPIEMNVQIKKKDIIELEIVDLAFGGASVAKVDGLVVLVRGGIPGDLVKAEITKKKSNYAEARVLQVIKESKLRTKPICSHFGFCGGCSWQDLKYEEQLKFKTKQVKDSLTHIGNFTDPPVQNALGCEKTFYYRNKMEYAFLPDLDKQFVLGLHPRGRYDLVFDLKECFLQSETANHIVDFVRQYAKDKNLPAYHQKNRSGLLRYLVIKEGKNTGMTMVNLVTNSGDFTDGDEFCKKLFSNFPQVKSVVRNINSKIANVAIGEEEELLGGERTITEKLGEFTFEISPNSFFQTNPQQAERLYNIVLNMADLGGAEEVLDLYCGNGTISIFLSPVAKKVIGIEAVEESVLNARRNSELNNIHNCEFICGESRKVLKTLEGEKREFHAVVLDPPRAGLHQDVIKSVVNLKPQKIVYVSCNPATLARDLKSFCLEEYRVEKVQPVDMFPHTFHIESVTMLSRK